MRRTTGPAHRELTTWSNNRLSGAVHAGTIQGKPCTTCATHNIDHMVNSACTTIRNGATALFFLAFCGGQTTTIRDQTGQTLAVFRPDKIMRGTVQASATMVTCGTTGRIYMIIVQRGLIGLIQTFFTTMESFASKSRSNAQRNFFFSLGPSQNYGGDLKQFELKFTGDRM